MTLSRRSLLRRGTLLGTVGLAGCVAGLPGDDDPRGTADLPRGLRFGEVILPALEQDSIEPIVVGDLPEVEREIVWMVLREGEYTLERDRGLPAFERLRDRIEARTGNGETLAVYLRRGDTTTASDSSTGTTSSLTSTSSAPGGPEVPGRVEHVRLRAGRGTREVRNGR